MILSKTTKLDSLPSPFPLPRSLFFLTCASLLGSCALLIVSMLDLGYLSMWLNPCASVITVGYHVGVILIARRRRNPNAPSYFSTVIFSAYLLFLVWFIAFILTIVVLASSYGKAFMVEASRQGFATMHTQRAQIFLTLYEMLVVGGMALRGHAIVRREGPDPDQWRNLESGEVCGLSVRRSGPEIDRSSGCRQCINRATDDRDHEVMGCGHLLKSCEVESGTLRSPRKVLYLPTVLRRGVRGGNRSLACLHYSQPYAYVVLNCQK
jgi:hypothetical protein